MGTRMRSGIGALRRAGLYNAPRPRLIPRAFAQPASSSASTTASSTSAPAQASRLRRAGRLAAIGVTCAAFGFLVMAAPAVEPLRQVLSPPTDAETLELFAPTHPDEREVEEFINAHPLAAEMRSKPGFSESRPHLKMPAQFRAMSLTAGTLLGPNRVVVPPVAWAEEGGKSLVTISHLGAELCGHPGIVHGGMLATMLDEGLARCCFAALPHNVGMTANLNINYRAPAKAGAYYVLRATTTKVEGRKAWVEGRIETLVDPGETPVVVAEATALFISPKHASLMAKVYPTDK